VKYSQTSRGKDIPGYLPEKRKDPPRKGGQVLNVVLGSNKFRIKVRKNHWRTGYKKVNGGGSIMTGGELKAGRPGIYTGIRGEVKG